MTPTTRWLCAAGGLILVAAAVLLTHPLRGALDIFFLDETGYLTRGMHMFPRIPKLWGPVYCFWYRILYLFQSDPVALFYLNFGLMSAGLSAVLYAFLVRFRVALPVAFWLAFMVLIAPFNLPTFPKVSHFATIGFLLLVSAAYSIRNSPDRWTVIALGFLVLSYVRPEFYLSFLLCAAGMALWMVRERTPFRVTPVMLAASAVFVILHFGLGIPLGVELRGYKRSFIAFGEHFSWNYSKWNGIDGYLWLTWEEVTAAQFGDSASIGSALKQNPAMFFRHIAYNLGEYGRALLETLTCSVLPLNPSERVSMIVPAIGGILAVSALAVGDVRREFAARLRHHRALLVFLALFALPSVISCLLIFPREHYLIIQFPLFIWLIAELLSTLWRQIPSQKGRALAGTAIGLFLIYSFISPRRPSDYTYFDMRKENGKLNNLEVLSLLDRHADALEGKRLLSHEGDFSAFTKADIDFVNAIEKGERPFYLFLDSLGADMIYATETMSKNPHYIGDPEWERFRGTAMNGTLKGWFRIPVDGGPYDFLLVRPDIYQRLSPAQSD